MSLGKRTGHGNSLDKEVPPLNLVSHPDPDCGSIWTADWIHLGGGLRFLIAFAFIICTLHLQGAGLFVSDESLDSEVDYVVCYFLLLVVLYIPPF